jgi:hypothetical protein
MKPITGFVPNMFCFTVFLYVIKYVKEVANMLLGWGNAEILTQFFLECLVIFKKLDYMSTNNIFNIVLHITKLK